MHLIFLITLTMLPSMVTASPLPSLTRDNVAKKSKNDMKVVQYLVKYGHLDDKLDVRNAIISRKHQQQPNMAEPSHSAETKHVFHPYTEDEISNGIKSFQNSFGLKVSGDLNEETRNVMETPRCGIPDRRRDVPNPFQSSLHHRSRRYKIMHLNKYGKYKKYKWSNTKVTWRIKTYYTGSGLSRQEQDETLEKAFKLWEHSSRLIFVRTTSRPDIDIEFRTVYHDDPFPFDGTGGELAHAFFPNAWKSGDIHFDAHESWNVNFLFNVAVHEIGHSIGLGHSSIPNSIMYPTYGGHSAPITALYQDDLNGLKALYGPCQTKIDAVIYLSNGDLYFIRKDLIWKYDSTSQRVVSGYPKNINDEFPTVSGPKIPSDLDCASRYVAGHIRKDFAFVKGNQVYIYNKYMKTMKVQTLAQFWPNTHGGSPLITSPVDAMLSITTVPVGTWIFKNDLVWHHDDFEPQRTIHPGFPKKWSQLKWTTGLPQSFDDAYYDDNHFKFYFFKDTQYWEMTMYDFYQPPKHRPAVIPGGLIHQKWKGICSAKY